MFKRIFSPYLVEDTSIVNKQKHFGTGIPILSGSTLPKFYEYRWYSRESTIV